MAGTTGGGAPGSGTLLWRATVDDKTGDFFVQFEGNLKKLTTTSGNAMNQVSQSTAKAAKSTDWLIAAFVGLGEVVGRFAEDALRRAVAVFEALVIESAKLAARADTLQVVMYTVGNNVGYTRKELDDLEKSITALGITTVAARQMLSEMAETGLELADSVELARIAQDAAVIADINSSDAMLRMIHGISTLNPLVLRRMGLIVSLNQAYQKYASTMGLNYEMLNTETRQMIATHAVMEAGTRIAGAYEAAMGTVGKRATSVTRFMMEFQTALGQAFKAGYGVFIDTFIADLERMTRWLKENQDAVREFGEGLARYLAAAVQAVNKLVDAMAALPKAIKEAGVQLAILFAEEGIVREREAGLWDYFKAAVGIHLNFIATAATVVVFTLKTFVLALGNSVEAAVNFFFALSQAATGNFKAAAEAMDRAKEATLDWGRTFMHATPEMLVAIQKNSKALLGFFGLIEESKDTGANAFNALLERLQILESEISDVTDRSIDIQQRMNKELADLNKQLIRDSIDLAIERSREVLEIERNHARRIEDIYRDYNKRKKELAEGGTDEEQQDKEKADNRLLDEDIRYHRKLEDVEISFQRKLADIREDAIAQLEEAARQNDAVSMARIMRETKRKLEEAVEGRDEDREDAARDHQRNLEDIAREQKEEREQRQRDRKKEQQDLEDDLADQLEEERRNYAQEREDRIRAWDEQDADTARHRQWEAEDRAEAWRGEIIQLAAHFADQKELTAEGLQKILDENAPFLAKDQDFWGTYYKTKSQELTAAIGDYLSQWQSYFTTLEHLQYLSRTGGVPDTGTPDLPQIYPGEIEAPSPWPTSFAKGGMELIRRPTMAMLGEEPELVAALPLSQVVTHNINMRGGINVTGVSPQMEGNVEGAIMDILNQFGQALLARQGVYA